jgi:hypothetical protein
MRKFILIFVIFYFFQFSLQAQNNPYQEINISSPTAAALGKYGDVPVSSFTGVPDVNIPIYTVKEGPLQLPISLSYHAGGVKLMEPASWVGLGWSLNAGGVITRSVQGAPDEYGTSGASSQTFGHFSNYGFNNYLYLDQDGDAPQGNYQDWTNFANGNKDGVPDFFFFNFNGYAGKFYFSDDRTPVIVPQQDFKIDYTYSPGESIQSFTITTTDGTKYIFGDDGNVQGTAPIEKTNPWSLDNGISSSKVISSWYLNRIESADGLFSIRLKYQSENYGYFTIGSHPVNLAYIQNNDHTGVYLIKNIVSGVRLSKISFDNGSVNFSAGITREDLSDNSLLSSETTNTSANALGQIQIEESSGLCETYSFDYDYFTDNATSVPSTFTALYQNLHTDTKRLKLLSLQMTSCTDASQSQPPYLFTYSTQSLPRRLCFAQDFWGYNNGHTTSNTLIPTYSTTINGNTTTYTGADRAPVWPAMEAGSLKTITYPTGGSTALEYESNDILEQHYSGYFNMATLIANMYGQSRLTDTKTLEITDLQHGFTMHATSVGNTNGSSVRMSLMIKNHSTGVPVTNYNPHYIDDSTDADLPAPDPATFNINESYDFILNVPSDTSAGCQVTINYNWTTTTTLQNTIVGGIRVKTITQNDNLPNTPDIVTNYSYYNNGNSTGVLYDIPTFIQPIRNNLIRDVGYWTVNGFQPYTLNPNGCPYSSSPEYYISAGNLRPMSGLQGYQIGYTQVTISQTGNGKTIHHYFAGDNTGYSQQYSPIIAVTDVDLSYCSSDIPNYPTPPEPFDTKRGEPYYDQFFDESGSLVKDIYYTPVFNTSVEPVTPVFVVSNLPTAGGGQYLGTFDSIRNVRKESETTVETDYTSAGNIVTRKEKYFSSNYHNSVTRETSNDSKGNDIETRYKYAFDFRITSCDNTNCLNDYSSDCDDCRQAYNVSRNACNNAECLTNAYTAYLLCNTTARYNFISCKKSAATSFESCHNTAKNAANSDLKPILEMQDRYMNSLIETNTWRNGNLMGSQFNKYSRTTDGAGNVYPEKVQDVQVSSLTSTFTNASVNGSGLTKDSRYKDEATIHYRMGNIHDITDKKGITTTYLWDYNNDFPVAKITGALPTDTIAYTSFESTGTGGWDLTSNARYKNSAMTGSRCYNLSSGNITKTLNPSVKYKVTFWSKHEPVVTGATKTLTGKTNFEKFKYYEYTTNNNVSSITIQGSQVLIDELRLYPVGAQMVTYTYDPLIGITNQCDENNVVTYYEYDAMGRLAHIRDQDNYIIKKYCYNYTGQSTPCMLNYQNSLQTKTFIKNDCYDTAYGGSEVIDSVQAGLYSSDISQAYADSLAAAYLEANGQSFANTNGTCLPRTNFILDNYAHVAGFTITFTNIYDSTLVYNIAIPVDADSTISPELIPQGRYNIEITNPENTNSYVFTVSGPAGEIQVNSDYGSWINVPVNLSSFNRISIGNEP